MVFYHRFEHAFFPEQYCTTAPIHLNCDGYLLLGCFAAPECWRATRNLWLPCCRVAPPHNIVGTGGCRYLSAGSRLLPTSQRRRRRHCEELADWDVCRTRQHGSWLSVEHGLRLQTIGQPRETQDQTPLQRLREKDKLKGKSWRAL